MIRTLIAAAPALFLATPAAAQTLPELRAAVDTIGRYVAAQEAMAIAPKPLAPIDWTAPAFTIDPAQAGPDDREVRVRIRASKPAPYTITMGVGLVNGTAYAPVFFDSGRSYAVTFPAGETEQIVTLPLLRELGAGRTIKVSVGGGANGLNNATIPTAWGLITGTAKPAAPVARAAAIVAPAPAAMRQGRRLVWSTDFLGAISPIKGQGLRTTLTGGDWIGNGGDGIIVDETRDPGLGSHPIVADEAGVLRRGLRLFDCDVTKNGKHYSKCLNTLTTNGAFDFRRGDFVTVRAKFPVGDGFQWAVWAMANSGWPPEIDIVETCLDMVAGKCRNRVNQHFTSAAGKHTMYGFTGFAPDGGWHDYGLDWRADGTLIYLLDGQEVFRAPSPIDVPMHLIVGGETNMGGGDRFRGSTTALLGGAEVWRP